MSLPIADASRLDFLTREVSTGDAAAVAALSEELGYAVSPEVMKQRIDSLALFTSRASYQGR